MGRNSVISIRTFQTICCTLLKSNYVCDSIWSLWNSKIQCCLVFAMVYQIDETEKIPNVFCLWYHSTFSGLVVIELFLEMPIFFRNFKQIISLQNWHFKQIYIMWQYIKSMKPKIPIVSMMYYQTHKAKIELYVNPPWAKWLAPYVGQLTIKLVILWF
jgi:hypothetical protein